MNNIEALRNVGNIGQYSSVNKTQNTVKNAPSFKATLKNFLNEVNENQFKADESVKKMMAGEITDVHQVMSTVGEAKLSMDMLLALREKALEGYQEIMRMRL